MILTDRGGKHLGWFKWDEAFNRADNINHAIYAFYFGEDKPSNKTWPYELKDSFYFGMACGKYHDMKNRKTWRGKLKSFVQDRLLKHNKYLSNLIEIAEDKDKYQVVTDVKKSKLFFEHFSPPLNPQCQRWVSISLPPDNYDTVALRALVSAVESEYILLYAETHKQTPLLNLDEIYESDRQRDSYSNRMMSSPSILKFCE